jgi:kynurenine 3-monooxygenase
MKGMYSVVNHDETYCGRGWTGSRGDICSSLEREILSRYNAAKLVFNTEANVVDINEGTVKVGTKVFSFDLIVGCDGGGSSVRAAMKDQCRDFSVESTDLGNHSIMLHFDQNTAELNPTWLHIFSPEPLLSVAGAICGEKGPEEPRWFCQIGFSGKKSFATVEEAEAFLQSANPLLLRYASKKSIADFSKRECLPTGKAKKCSSLAAGRVVLLGDAGAPVPPIGQGVNAAMESAAVLGGVIGASLSSGLSANPSDRLFVSRKIGNDFNKAWKPEVDALLKIALQVDLSKWYTLPRVLSSIVFGYSGLQAAKNGALSYQQARNRQVSGEIVLGLLLAAAVGGIMYGIFK